MKRILLFVLAALTCNILQALPVDSKTALQAAKNYLAANESGKAECSLTLYSTWYGSSNKALMYVFNIDTTGFIIMAANDAVSPVVGYSLNGTYDSTTAPDNLKGWLMGYLVDMDAFLACEHLSEETLQQQSEWVNEWVALRQGDREYYTTKGAKGVSALVNTHWSQGSGYNNYCPIYQGHHAVTGCVATAMAQIIRYHSYPNTGFYHHSYSHEVYGGLSVRFDTAHYDYTKMPVSVNAYSPADEQHEVSQLCYHCGIAVNMEYEHAGHTSGSGAFSQAVPEAFLFFGYANSYYLAKHTVSNEVWDSLLHHDLDRHLPVYYSGTSSSGGHAFVCDGYNNSGKYHFNFGWGGSGDGYYSLTSVNGFSAGQAAVFNISPSGIGALLDTVYIDANGHGDGSSWENANPNLVDAIILRGLYKDGSIWVKSGTYYGNTESDAAFTMRPGVNVYGGFSGTEQSIDERNPNAAPSIMSGRGERQVMSIIGLNKTTRLNRMTLADGYAPANSALEMITNLLLEFCVIENNRCSDPNNAAVFTNGATMLNCIVRNNHCGGVILSGGNIKNSLIMHNENYGIQTFYGNSINCNIVSNLGYGILNNDAEATIRNCVIWNNDTSVSPIMNNLFFCAVEGFESIDSNSNIGLSSENNPSEGYGPNFVDPSTTRGPVTQTGDWHLQHGSILINAGDTLLTGVYFSDLDNNSRIRDGRIDIGCYESIPNSFIQNDYFSKIKIYPNPASESISVEGLNGTSTIFDITGHLVMSINSNGSNTRIDISTLHPGLYLLRDKDGNTARFIKQ